MAIDGIFCDLCADKIAETRVTIHKREYDICGHCEALCPDIEREEVAE